MANKNVDEIVAGLLKNVTKKGAKTVQLPSGIEVSLRPLDFDDELALFDVIDKASSITNEMLDRCLTGATVDSLPLFDKTFILKELVELSQGPKLELRHECTTCGEPSLINFDLSKVPVVRVPEDFEDPQTVVLKDSGLTAKVYVPRISHEKYMRTGKGILENLWRFVESFDDESASEIKQKVISGISHY